ncbi:MAG: FAD:protein FMN transferase, partial [Bdellovibrionales bacterium]|nr:FAD:protein FMN transferase [Bdellovibrionales bacterium]
MKIGSRDSFRIVEFEAMASPCEIFFEEKKQGKTEKIAAILVEEAKRLEKKYSRYLPDSIVSQINNSNGKTTDIDTETYQLLNYAKT